MTEGNCIICDKITNHPLRSEFDGRLIPNRYICPDCELRSAVGTDPTGVL